MTFEKWINEKSKEKLNYPVKIYYLKIIFLFITFGGMIFIKKNQIAAMHSFTGVLIGVLTLFIVTVVISGFLTKLKNVSTILKNELNKQINKSIDLERAAKKYSTKLNHLRRRDFLYSLAGEIEIERFHSAILYGFIALILSSLIGFFEFKTPFNVNNGTSGEIVWTLSNWHIQYIFMIIGLYFTLKIVLYFYEIIRKTKIEF